MSVDTDPIDPDHEYHIKTSDTPQNVDGYHKGEPKEIECDHCDARMVLTEEKTPGIWSVTHERNCPNADAS